MDDGAATDAGVADDMDDGAATDAGVATAAERERESRDLRLAALLSSVVEYGTFALAAVLLLLASLANHVHALNKIVPNSDVGIYVCFIFLALFGFIYRLIRKQSAVELAMDEVIDMTRTTISRVQPSIESLKLTDVFQSNRVRGVAPQRMRVFALTTRYLFQQLRSESLRAELVEIMVAAGGGDGGGADDGGAPGSDKMLPVEVGLAIEYSWAARVRNGQIDTMRVYQYKFFPTDWYVIFDDSLMVMGTYVFDQNAVGNVAPSTTVLLVQASGSGRDLINAKIDAFDRLAATEDQRIRGGPHEGEYKLIKDKVARRCPQETEWSDLPSISQTILPSIGQRAPAAADPGAPLDADSDARPQPREPSDGPNVESPV